MKVEPDDTLIRRSISESAAENDRRSRRTRTSLPLLLISVWQSGPDHDALPRNRITISSLGSSMIFAQALGVCHRRSRLPLPGIMF